MQVPKFVQQFIRRTVNIHRLYNKQLLQTFLKKNKHLLVPTCQSRFDKLNIRFRLSDKTFEDGSGKL